MPAVSTDPTPPTNTPATFGDGGFQAQLRHAQDSQAVRGIPGSDVLRAPGMQFTRPQDQGIGAVMRSAQRLFGVTNKHCIDVEVWGNMSPQELIERHLTPADVRAANEKYQCNRPLGLSF